jgi:hypothetical protein
MKARVLLAVAVMVFGCYTTGAWAQPEGYAHDSNDGAYKSQSGDDGAVLPDSTPNPGPQYMHVDLFPLGAEIGVPGFWRLRVRPGFTWVDGRWDSDNFIPGFWRPNVVRDKNTAWVAGHWAGQRWIAGQWRPASRKGFGWVEGHWSKNGEWLEGSWRPVQTAARGMIWEPGFWGPRGWVEGFWRPEARVGYLWVGGEWDEKGAWQKGRWQTAKREDFWVRGYFDRQGHKVPGHVVKVMDRTAPYAPGHYNQRGEWVEPRWGEQRREDRREDRRDDRRENRRDDRQGENRGGYDQHQGGQQDSGRSYGNERNNDNHNGNNSNNNYTNGNSNNHQPDNTAPQGNYHRPPVVATPGSQGGDNSNAGRTH